MFNYYLKLAFKSIKRNFILSTLMVMAIALGIGASITTITVNYLMSADPISQKSKQLFYVQVDSWDPNEAYSDNSDDVAPPPNQLTWTEATNLMAAQKATKQAAMAKSGGIIQPQSQDAKPFEASIRLTFADFFSMFNVPFIYGSSWDQQSDNNRDLVVVLSKNINDKVFGGENSVGKNFIMAGSTFRVVGVMDNWQPVPKFYDIGNGAFDVPEEVFMPFYLKEELELPNWGNVNCWKTPEGEGFKAFLRSECINFQMWVELENDSEKANYLGFLDNYVAAQKDLGRFPRPLNNRLSDVMTWMESQKVVDQDAKLMMWLSFMFLLVCLLNTIGLLLAKFSSKAAEIGLRRAVGASKSDLFKQHIIEAGCIGLLGGIVGIALAFLGLQGVKSLYGDFIDNLATLDTNMVILAILLAVVSSVLAGLYPTWRACNIAPASQLKSQ
jgi:putative ABC transport system permease protein